MRRPRKGDKITRVIGWERVWGTITSARGKSTVIVKYPKRRYLKQEERKRLRWDGYQWVLGEPW